MSQNVIGMGFHHWQASPTFGSEWATLVGPPSRRVLVDVLQVAEFFSRDVPGVNLKGISGVLLPRLAVSAPADGLHALRLIIQPGGPQGLDRLREGFSTEVDRPGPDVLAFPDADGGTDFS